jgi:hypothetical protein
VPAALPHGFVSAFSWQHANSGDIRRLPAAIGSAWLGGLHHQYLRVA